MTFHDMDFTVNDDYSQNQALVWNAFTCTHRGGTATTTAKAICEVCGEEYGDLLPETPNEEIPPAPSAPADETPAESTIPKTGDDANLIFPLIAMLLSACAIAVLLGMRKRNF